MYKAALVLEGGALRGQYTAGVLDAFLDHDIHFETVIGVSAGALCGTNYISEQRGRTNQINTEYRHDKNYISMRRVFHRQDIINLNYLFEPHGDNWVNFDATTYRRSASKFVVVATALEHGRAVYFDHPVGREMMQVLKASSSMPFISAPTKTDQGLCLDGGIADSIPYAYAQLSGYDKVVVIRTREREYRKNSTGTALRYAYERAFKQYPEFVQAAIARPEMYNQQVDRLNALEQAGEVFVLAPAEPVTVGRLEPDTEKLQALYETALAQTNALVPELRKYLEK